MIKFYRSLGSLVKRCLHAMVFWNRPMPFSRTQTDSRADPMYTARKRTLENLGVPPFQAVCNQEGWESVIPIEETALGGSGILRILMGEGLSWLILERGNRGPEIIGRYRWDNDTELVGLLHKIYRGASRMLTPHDPVHTGTT